MSTETIDLAAGSFSTRDRARQARTLGMSPAERLAAMRRLLEQSRAILEQNPEGLAHFWRRNFAARAVGRNVGGSADDS